MRENILGVPVDMLTLQDAVAAAEGWVRDGGRRYVCLLDARSVLAARDDPAVAQAMAGAALAGPDGMPLVWLGRRRGHRVGRVYGPDFMTALMAATSRWPDRPCRHALVGSTPAVLALLERRLRIRHPDAAIVGTVAPPMGAWDAVEDGRIRAALEALAADIVWVGLSSPHQDLWMAHQRDRLSAPLLVGVGAAFDFLSGNKPQAPRWLRHLGLEWLFRLATEPRRLAKRYAATVPRFAFLALREEMTRRRAR
ncbi:MAG: WecB/TagA/CpsF family glycosyltransferase [Alphaproteobacteria bacterium]